MMNYYSRIFLLLFMFHIISQYCSSQDAFTYKKQPEEPQKLLLSRIDLDLPKLKEITICTDNDTLIGYKLLEYYRSRTSIKHPIERNLRSKALGKTASEKDIEIANDALNHVFVGQSSYPRFFCGKDIKWDYQPVADKEWVWQLNRMPSWNSMGRVYWHTGDERYVEEWGEQLCDWVRKNPNDENHEYAWRSIEAGIRGYSWIELYQRFIDSPSFTPQILVTFLNSLYDHASYLMTKYSSLSNWALMEAEGLATIGIMFPEFKDAEKWKSEAIRRLNNEINLQVYPDGHQRELAIGYHIGSIDWFLRTYELAKMNGIKNVFPPSYIRTIEKMCEIPLKIGHPDGRNAQFGDAFTGMPGQYKERFKKWANLFQRDDFLYLGTDGKKGVAPDSTAFCLPYSGLYSMRSEWNKNAIFLVLKCGPDGGWHCHPDNGTFELSAGGRILMPDAGCYIYSGDPENRAWFRQTKVHQTLTLNDENLNYKPKLIYWNASDSLDILVIENKSYENLIHRRAVFFVNKRYFVIVDEAVGSALGDVALHFQLAPGNSLMNKEDFSFRSDFNEGWNVFVRTNTQEGLEFVEEEGQVSFEYTIKEPRRAFAYQITKKDPNKHIHFLTLVIPYNSTIPDIKIQSSINSIDDIATSLQLKVMEENIAKEIGYNL